MKASTGFALAGVLLLLFAGKAKASGTKMVTVTATSGPKRDRKSSYEGDIETWAHNRYAKAHAYLVNVLHMSDPEAHDAALSVLAHWSLETGGGQGEYNFNVGNIHASGSDAWFTSGDTDTSGKKYQATFAAYDKLDDGVRAYFELLANRYEDCLQALYDHPAEADWFKCLGRNGYYAATLKGKDNIEPAAAGWAARRANLAQYASD